MPDGPTDALNDGHLARPKKPGHVGAAHPLDAEGFSSAVATIAAVDDSVAPQQEESVSRRGRHRRGVHKRRRRIVAFAAAGGAIVILLGAAAAIAAQGTGPDVPDVRVTPGSSGDAPTINRFTSGAASAVCIAPEGETQVPLNWAIERASRVAIASASKEVDAFEKPLHDDLPAEASQFLVSYPCKEASRAYTLLAESPDGGRVSTVVIVSRTIARTSTPTPTPTEAPPRKQGGGQPYDNGTEGDPDHSGGTDGGSGVPDPGVIPAPDPVPEPEPTHPTPQPSPEPTPQPTPEPTSPPEETPPPQPGDPTQPDPAGP